MNTMRRDVKGGSTLWKIYEHFSGRTRKDVCDDGVQNVKRDGTGNARHTDPESKITGTGFGRRTNLPVGWCFNY